MVLVKTGTAKTGDATQEGSLTGAEWFDPSAYPTARFEAATFKLGRDEILIPGSSQHIGLYSAERTIVDCFRLRSTVGYEVVRDATKEWLRRGGKPAELMAFATQLPRAKAPLLQTLEVIT